MLLEESNMFAKIIDREKVNKIKINNKLVKISYLIFIILLIVKIVKNQ